MMLIDVLTIFPEVFLNGTLDFSTIKRAREKGAADFNVTNIRDYAKDRHRTTDDAPFGGGEGMVMKIEPVYGAIEAVRTSDSRVILLSASGKKLTQQKLEEFAKLKHMIFVCGRYEGFDERVLNYVDEEISIGDYVLSGGEFAAMVIIEGIIRLLPGVLGNEESKKNESFTTGILDYPQFTRPREFKGLKVPDVLFSGNHEKIKKWREQEAINKTMKNRPDIMEEKAKNTRNQEIRKERSKKNEKH